MHAPGEQRSPFPSLLLLPCPADPAAAARRRAATMCQLTGVGEAGGEEASPRTMQAALGEVRSGAAYRESPYSDGVSEYLHQGGAANGPGSS